MIGNVPFADVKLDTRAAVAARLLLRQVVDARSPAAPGPVTSTTLDKQNAATREYLAERTDFLGAIRLPSDAFKNEGTRVVTDIVFLRKRSGGEQAHHADPAWL